MRSQVEILVESIANLHIQLSASLSRESELRDQNIILAEKLNDLSRVRTNSAINDPAALLFETDKEISRVEPKLYDPSRTIHIPENS